MKAVISFLRMGMGLCPRPRVSIFIYILHMMSWENKTGLKNEKNKISKKRLRHLVSTT